jgi:hypothetical protein
MSAEEIHSPVGPRSEGAVATLTVPLRFRPQPGRSVRGEEQEIRFVHAAA